MPWEADKSQHGSRQSLITVTSTLLSKLLLYVTCQLTPYCSASCDAQCCVGRTSSVGYMAENCWCKVHLLFKQKSCSLLCRVWTWTGEMWSTIGFLLGIPFTIQSRPFIKLHSELVISVDVRECSVIYIKRWSVFNSGVIVATYSCDWRYRSEHLTN